MTINPGDKREGDLDEVEFRRAANVIFLETEGDIIIPFPIVPCLLQLNVPTINNEGEKIQFK